MMKGSQELIAHFNKRETELKEKATKFNMFLEGYAVGYNDTKPFMIGKFCEWVNDNKQPVLASEIDDTIVGYSISVERFLEWLKAIEE